MEIAIFVRVDPRSKQFPMDLELRNYDFEICDFSDYRENEITFILFVSQQIEIGPLGKPRMIFAEYTHLQDEEYQNCLETTLDIDDPGNKRARTVLILRDQKLILLIGYTKFERNAKEVREGSKIYWIKAYEVPLEKYMPEILNALNSYIKIHHSRLEYLTSIRNSFQETKD